MWAARLSGHLHFQQTILLAKLEDFLSLVHGEGFCFVFFANGREVCYFYHPPFITTNDLELS